MLLVSISVYAEEIDMSGFDDAPTVVKTESKIVDNANDALLDGFDDASTRASTTTDIIENTEDEATAPEKEPLIKGVTGKLTQELAYSPNDVTPHDGFSSIKSSIFLDYENKSSNGWKIKVNARAYYDSIYKLKGTNKFNQNELDELQSEVELFDAYVEGSLADNLDLKVGRQVVVWGRSDTIRVTDRRPGMVDIEDLRLPVAMAKLDYFVGDWRVTPIAIFEQRFSKNPPMGSSFSPAPSNASPLNAKKYNDVTYALSIGGEFSGWDINFYGAKVRDDAGYIQNPRTASQILIHDKVTMFGTAVNILSGSWLFKTELAYFDGLKYTSTPNKKYKRTDALLGVEYNGIADTMISYDVVTRKISGYDSRLINELNPLEAQSYQHAFRISSDFMNASLKANYLISLYGKALDKGGFQRVWIDYEIADGINTSFGVVDYIGGSKLFDTIKNNDMVFANISYSF